MKVNALHVFLVYKVVLHQTNVSPTIFIVFKAPSTHSLQHRFVSHVSPSSHQAGSSSFFDAGSEGGGVPSGGAIISQSPSTDGGCSPSFSPVNGKHDNDVSFGLDALDADGDDEGEISDSDEIAKAAAALLQDAPQHSSKTSLPVFLLNSPPSHKSHSCRNFDLDVFLAR